jgi:hypothetical protein
MAALVQDQFGLAVVDLQEPGRAAEV